MDAYTGFAEVYDMFMDNIPYETWCEYLTGLLKEQGVIWGAAQVPLPGCWQQRDTI